MKTVVYSYPKSSFLSVEKDLGILVNMMMKNERLKKMLYYTSNRCLEQPNLTDEQTLDLFGKNIKIVPKLTVDNEVLTYILINFDKFIPNSTNTEFRDNIIEFDIICHFDQWHLKDFELRPYKIAAEIDSMLNNQRLTGIGQLEFIGATQTVLTDEFAGICLLYQAVHGEEDKKFMPNPADNEAFIADFNAMYNDK